MGCTSPFPLPLSQVSIKARMGKLIRSQNGKWLINGKQNCIKVINTSEAQSSKSHNKHGTNTKSNNLGQNKAWIYFRPIVRPAKHTWAISKAMNQASKQVIQIWSWPWKVKNKFTWCLWTKETRLILLLMLQRWKSSTMREREIKDRT